MVSTQVELSGIRLDNPVIPSSGTFGYGYEFAELYDINCLGTLSFKGTTVEPRFGDPPPRSGVGYTSPGPRDKGGVGVAWWA